MGLGFESQRNHEQSESGKQPPEPNLFGDGGRFPLSSGPRQGAVMWQASGLTNHALFVMESAPAAIALRLSRKGVKHRSMPFQAAPGRGREMRALRASKSRSVRALLSSLSFLLSKFLTDSNSLFFLRFLNRNDIKHNLTDFFLSL